MTVSQVDYERWLKVVYGRIAHYFSRAEPRRRAWNYLIDLPKAHSVGLRNGENVGHYLGENRADGAQRLLTSARWDESSVRDEIRSIAGQCGGRTGGAFFITEVAFPKKGRSAVAVERQYSSETQKVENCQIGVVLFYVTADQQAFLIDFELYLPRSWAMDAARRQQAQIPPEVCYRSKSSIAAAMVERAWQGSLRPSWVACSLICSDQATLHTALRRHQLQHIFTSTAGEMRAGYFGTQPAEAAATSVSVPLQGPAPGHEVYTYRHSVLHRFSRPAGSAKLDLSYLVISAAGRQSKPRSYFTACLHPTATLAEVAPVVLLMEASAAYCRAAKEDIGLGHYEVRSWRGWYRHMTLAAAAHMALELAKRDSPAGTELQLPAVKGQAC